MFVNLDKWFRHCLDWNVGWNLGETMLCWVVCNCCLVLQHSGLVEMLGRTVCFEIGEKIANLFSYVRIRVVEEILLYCVVCNGCSLLQHIMLNVLACLLVSIVLRICGYCVMARSRFQCWLVQCHSRFIDRSLKLC